MKNSQSLVCLFCLLMLTACQGAVDFPNYDPALDGVDQGGGGEDVQGEDMAPGPDMPGDMPGPGPDMPGPGPDMPDGGPDMPGDMPGPDPDMPDPEPDMPDPPEPALNEAVMVDTILPGLQVSGCSIPTCHGNNAIGNNFKLDPNDVQGELAVLTSKVNFELPGTSILLQRGRDRHEGAFVNDEFYCQIFLWIDAADGNADQVCSPP